MGTVQPVEMDIMSANIKQAYSRKNGQLLKSDRSDLNHNFLVLGIN